MVERKVLKQFNKGCVDYHLLEDGDRILIEWWKGFSGTGPLAGSACPYL
mgnify:CR=1 FL=1